MQHAIRVVAGDCTIRYDDGDETRDRCGRVVAVVKPDNTVLVHDADGYQPAAWLTRADTVRFVREAGSFRLVAGKGDERLRVTGETLGHARYPVSPAGPPVGTCPDCGGTLVRDGGRVACTDCAAAYGLPRDATVLEETCEDCGLPRLRVERGAPVEACVDRDCEPLAEVVAERFDGAWCCPDCDAALRVGRDGGLRAVCPDCERSLPIPPGVVCGTCACGLPLFERGDRTRCPDPGCEAA